MPAPDAGSVEAGDDEEVYSTSEGPVVITTRGKMVFVAESFPLPLARKLPWLILDSQASGATRMAYSKSPSGGAGTTAMPLTGNLVQFFENCGVMKAAIDADTQSVR